MSIISISEFQRENPSIFDFEKPLKEKKFQQAVELLDAVVSYGDWKADINEQKKVQQLISKIKAADSKELYHHTAFKKTKKKFKLALQWNREKADGALRAPIKAPITTAQIKNREQARVLADISESWRRTLLPFKNISKTASANLSQEEKMIITDSDEITEDVLCELEQPFDKNRPIYIAFSQDRIEGIAIQKKNKIGLLCTNPYNLPLYGLSAPSTRGAGTALVTHIAQKILSTAEFNGQGIRLQSLTSARPFYEKLGFKEDPLRSNRFCLDRLGCEELVNKKPETHTIGVSDILQLRRLKRLS